MIDEELPAEELPVEAAPADGSIQGPVTCKACGVMVSIENGPVHNAWHARFGY